MGRRSAPRFAVAAPWEGAVRILRDVVVLRSGRDELVALSSAPGVVGEQMHLELMGAGATVDLNVNVAESRPVIVDGSVRHRIRLTVSRERPQERS